MRRYEPRDLATINEWRAARHADPLPFTPHLGFTVPGVAFGALILSDVGYGFIDGFTSNPDASSIERGEALQDITVALINESSKRGVLKLLVLTSDPEIAVRARNGGGQYLGIQMVFGMCLPAERT